MGNFYRYSQLKCSKIVNIQKNFLLICIINECFSWKKWCYISESLYFFMKRHYSLTQVFQRGSNVYNSRNLSEPSGNPAGPPARLGRASRLGFYPVRVWRVAVPRRTGSVARPLDCQYHFCINHILTISFRFFLIYEKTY